MHLITDMSNATLSGNQYLLQVHTCRLVIVVQAGPRHDSEPTRAVSLGYSRPWHLSPCRTLICGPPTGSVDIVAKAARSTYLSARQSAPAYIMAKSVAAREVSVAIDAFACTFTDVGQMAVLCKRAQPGWLLASGHLLDEPRTHACNQNRISFTRATADSSL